jgi:hypothetical protein
LQHGGGLYGSDLGPTRFFWTGLPPRGFYMPAGPNRTQLGHVCVCGRVRSTTALGTVLLTLNQAISHLPSRPRDREVDDGSFMTMVAHVRGGRVF